jgi:hypothetical protein
MTSETDLPTLYCANHPNVETTLRCNRCNKPICSRCAVLTPTGYRCQECVRGQQKMFETTAWFDYPLAFFLAVVLSYIGGQLVTRLGFFTIFLAPIAGVIIAEAIRLVVRRRRSKRLYQLSAAAAALGGAIPILLYLTTFLFMLSQGGLGGIGFLFPLIWQGVYVFIVTSTVYYRLGGIRI